jgi:hypothetical protein
MVWSIISQLQPRSDTEIAFGHDLARWTRYGNTCNQACQPFVVRAPREPTNAVAGRRVRLCFILDVL